MVRKNQRRYLVGKLSDFFDEPFGRSDAGYNQQFVFFLNVFPAERFALIPEYRFNFIVSDMCEVDGLVGQQLHVFFNDAVLDRFHILLAFGDDNHVCPAYSADRFTQAAGGE